VSQDLRVGEVVRLTPDGDDPMDDGQTVEVVEVVPAFQRVRVRTSAGVERFVSPRRLARP
jgi:hypothetical protein